MFTKIFTAARFAFATVALAATACGGAPEELEFESLEAAEEALSISMGTGGTGAKECYWDSSINGSGQACKLQVCCYTTQNYCSVSPCITIKR